MAGDADLIVLGGRIFTSRPDRPWARAFAARDGRIVAVGTPTQAERWRGRGTRVLDLRGRAVVPGFIDAHAHLASSVRRAGWTDLSRTRSLEEAVATIRAAAARAPRGAWVLATDWDDGKWPERRYPTREDFDRASADRPVLALRMDRHMGSVNSRGLEEAGDLRGVRGFQTDPAGRPTGILKEEAFVALWRRLEGDPTRDQAALAGGVRRMHRLGVTSVHDVVDPRGWRAYQRLRRGGRLSLRVTAMPTDELLPHLLGAGLRTGLGDEWLRLGAVKLFADGSLGARTALLREAYADGPGRGLAVHDPADLRDLLARAHGGGLQTATHAIGDAAIDLVLEGLEALVTTAADRAARHRIEHFELPDEDALRRMRAGGFVASCQPNFIGGWSGPGDVYEARLGGGRAAANNPYRRILRLGIPLCFGSDGMPYGPLNGVHWAVNGFFPGQRISPEDAVRAYTAGGAYAAFEERAKGTLDVGRLADFVVLDGDPFRDPERIRGMRVRETWIAGRRVHGPSSSR